MELGIGLEEFVIISVGELNQNKNHKIIIEALAEMRNPRIKYFICGQGELYNDLKNLIQRKVLENQVYLLGFREDIKELLYAADVCREKCFL